MSSPTLIFDLGNVVLTNDHPFHTGDQAKEFCSHYEISLDDWYRGWESSWLGFRIGKTTEDEFWRKLLAYSLSEKTDIEFAKNFWRKNQKAVGDMPDLLGKLKKNYRLAALTTIGREWLSYKRKKFNLDNYFEIVVSSGASGFVKPDTRAYSLILEKLSEDPKNCIFIDDLEHNLPPAQKLGMKALLFSTQKQLEKDLKPLGIEF